MSTTLFVAGFGIRTRARDLAYEFERYGRLVRCDIPAPKNHSSKPYAFVEFEDSRDAEASFNEMHGRQIDGYTISVQWAKNSPSASWRLERPRYRSPSPRPHSYGRSRSRSPYGGRSPPPYPPHDPGYYPYPRHGGPSLRGRSPPPPHHSHDRYYRSRSPPPPLGRHYDDYLYQPTTRGRSGSMERRSPLSTSPPPPHSGHHHRRPSPPSHSPSPSRRSPSPRRSRSPERN